ncbi:MAG: hypothetical protein ACREN4_00305 [Candidatus Dormibacteria bacterium]
MAYPRSYSLDRHWVTDVFLLFRLFGRRGNPAVRALVLLAVLILGIVLTVIGINAHSVILEVRGIILVAIVVIGAGASLVGGRLLGRGSKGQLP